MKISSDMKKALDRQVGMEGYASSYYLAMASWCEVTGFDGAAAFFYTQTDEERQHMLKIVRHLNKIGTAAEIQKIDQPPSKFESLEAICNAALKSERAVTKTINDLVDLAHKEGDHATFTFLQWYVSEQIEEEARFETILQKFELIGRDRLALAEIDRILGAMAIVDVKPA